MSDVRSWRRGAGTWALVILTTIISVAFAAEKNPPAEKKPPRFRTITVQGEVVWMADALKQSLGISTVKEAHDRVLALRTKDGKLRPLVEDLRGRSFRTDDRLRGKPMELLVREYPQHPLLQVIRIYEITDGKKYEVDYWCDVCAIIMFERDFCACCQDNNRLRHRLVVKGKTTNTERPQPRDTKKKRTPDTEAPEGT